LLGNVLQLDILNRDKEETIKNHTIENEMGKIIFFITMWRNEYKSQEAPHRLLHLNRIFSSIEKPPPKRV
jgi:hypothetical protein